MKPFLEAESATLEITVTDAMTVQFDQLGALHGVYSTYTMAKHFEEAGRKLLVPHLEAGEEGIGSSLSVEHLASALPGMRVRIVGTFQRLDGRTLYCTMEAWNQLGDLIGRGSTAQVVLPREKLEHRFAQLESRWMASQTRRKSE